MSDDLLSGEQVRLLLHISKRRAAWMLQNGYIPCTDTGNGQDAIRCAEAILSGLWRTSKRIPSGFTHRSAFSRRLTLIARTTSHENCLPIFAPGSKRASGDTAWH